MTVANEVKITPRSKRKGFDGSSSAWESEIRGRKLNTKAQQYIDSLPRVETKSAQNSEILAELHENNAANASKGQLPDAELMKRNEHQRRGKLMHYMTFLKKLRSVGIKCWYNANPWEGIIGLRAVRKGYEQLGVQYICGVKMGWTTEYDIFHYDQYGIEKNRKFIGWRSVLIQLIAKGVITEAQAHQLFGKPQLCDASLLYRRALWQIRSDRGRISD
jgi:hypothetical protein